MPCSIREYLAQLEAELAPTTTEARLRSLLLETEAHLTERAQEFQEIGLDRPMAEWRAIQAFGAPEEVMEENPPQVEHRDPPKKEGAHRLPVEIRIGILAALSAPLAVVDGGFATVFWILAATMGVVCFARGWKYRSAPYKVLLPLFLLSAVIAAMVDGARMVPGSQSPLLTRGTTLNDAKVALQSLEYQVIPLQIERQRTFETYYQQAIAKRTIWMSEGGSRRPLIPSQSSPTGLRVAGDPVVNSRGHVVADPLEAWKQDGSLVKARLADETFRTIARRDALRKALSMSSDNRFFQGVQKWLLHAATFVVILYVLQILGGLLADAAATISRFRRRPRGFYETID